MRTLKDDEAPRGFDYEPGLQLVSLDPDDDEYRWQNHALCHGLYDVFDLVDGVGKGDQSAATENKYRLKAARKICFACPVFKDCWEDAFTTLPRSVIRAGTRLGSGFAKTREDKLLVTLSLWEARQEHQKENQQNVG